MQALTIKQPHASAIMRGEKTEEYRGWIPAKQLLSDENMFFVHAGKTIDRKQTWTPIKDFDYPTSALLGIVKITGIECYTGVAALTIYGKANMPPKKYIYGWQLEVVEVFPEPIPAKGRLGFWDTSIEVVGLSLK